jgi:sulfonate transport system substrate-binding protein
LNKETARILINSDDLGIPSLGVFTARADVLKDDAKTRVLADFLNRVRLHWTWYGKNLPVVQQRLVEKMMQTPDRAKYFAAYGASVFYPLDDDLVRREQVIADALLATHDINRKIDVGIEFNRRFNAATVTPA